MDERVWLSQYPAGVPAEVDVARWPSLVAMLDECLHRHAARPAYRFLGHTIRYAEVDAASRALAAWLQSQGLQRGERVAVMLPNVPQFPVAVAAILRAGLVVVNVNPLYTPRELQLQLADSGARALFVLESGAATLQAVAGAVPVRRVVLCAAGDMLPWPRRAWADRAARRAAPQARAVELPGAVRWRDALQRGRDRPLQDAALGPQDIALLQYTGGTTGSSKAAVLLHRNLLANLLQAEAWHAPALARLPDGEQHTTACALPMYHGFGFTVVMLLGLRRGGCGVLIPDARDIGAMLKALSHERIHGISGVNTMYQALLRHPDFDTVDWGHLVLSASGGMAVRQATARQWRERTGSVLCEGYGLTEASPSVTCNPVVDSPFNGTAGLPLPGTDLRLLDEQGRPVPAGLPGEVAVRGPQVMAGYWQRPEETARVMTADGFLRTGDIGTLDERGWLRIVDRKKDMILVSGFTVFPNEVEEVLSQLPGVREVAVVGIADDRSGEAVRAVVVRDDPSVTEAAVRAWCEIHLTGYKRPRVVEFRAALPKSALGKVLRRELRGT